MYQGWQYYKIYGNGAKSPKLFCRRKALIDYKLAIGNKNKIKDIRKDYPNQASR